MMTTLTWQQIAIVLFFSVHHNLAVRKSGFESLKLRILGSVRASRLSGSIKIQDMEDMMF